MALYRPLRLELAVREGDKRSAGQPRSPDAALAPPGRGALPDDGNRAAGRRRGHRGGAGPPPTGAGPCPWKDVTEIVVWNYDHLRIIGLARRGDTVGGGPPARALAPRAPQPSRPTRRRAVRRHPTYSLFIAPDGSPYDAANVVTTNGWCVDTARLQAIVRHFAPRARFVDLSGATRARIGGPIGYAFEILAGLVELIGWRRLGWLLGVAASAAVPGRRGRQSRHSEATPRSA